MEIVLTGVNIGDFGAHQEATEETFFDLINALERETDIPRYRISSIEPNLCEDRIIEFVSSSQRFMPHFHMPLQSGCDRTLRRMRRRYVCDLYARRVEKIKKEMPHACIGADMIVGFPGETEEDFMESHAFIDALDVSYLHVFTYSERPGTPAAEMPEHVPMQVRRERHDVLQQLSEKKRRIFYDQHVGEVREVLLEKSKTPGWLHGFTDNYIRISVPASGFLVNQLVDIRIGPAHLIN
jgi:threonylcarbamoyladenosine tRNA methylthiotransferase MtaB